LIGRRHGMAVVGESAAERYVPAGAKIALGSGCD
jgi:hypothetical protein